MTTHAQTRQVLRYYPVLALIAAAFLPYSELPTWVAILFLVGILLAGLCAFATLFDKEA